MVELKFMKEMALDPKLFSCPLYGEGKRIGVHSRVERLLKRHECGKCFGEAKGTVLENLQYPKWVVILVLSLIGHGCPIRAIEACFLSIAAQWKLGMKRQVSRANGCKNR